MIIKGYINNFDGKVLEIVAPFSEHEAQKMFKQRISEVEIRLDDGRTISGQQRRYIYALIRDIGAYTGHHTEELKDHFKTELVAQTGCKWFSLSDCSVTRANELIELLIQFCLDWDIPTLDNLAGYAPDIAKYVYMCLMAKKCCCCGKKTELHHVDAVGMGRDRKQIVHVGMRVLPLCRQHHAECHNVGNVTFQNKYKIYGIKADEEICRVYKLRKVS